MSHDETRLGPEERELVERVAESYAPRAWTPAERSAFDARLESRLEGRARIRLLWPALGAATVAVAAAALWLARPAELEPAGSGSPVVAQRLETDTPGSLDELLLTYESFYGDEEAGALDTRALPEDYVAIAALLLEN
jgi:hypothetical protein